MTNIVVLGKDGQVGTELQRSLAPIAALRAIGRELADLSQIDSVYRALHHLAPRIIVNAAAYTAVDRAESEPHQAQMINADAVGVMADYAKKSGALLVHYSTDYVFDGAAHTPYTEQHAPNPQNTYGKSKLAGEQRIIDSGCDHLIFRTSWVFAGHSNNFLRTMMRLAMEREQLTVVDDQIGAPTSAALIADITALAIWAYQRGQLDSGLYHLTAAGQTSWHGFAQYIVEQMVALDMQPRVQPKQVLPISTSQYPTPAARPAYSVLSTDKLCSALHLHLPSWQHHTRQAVAQLSQFLRL